MLFPKKNIGTQPSMDEPSLFQGELYTFLLNKDGKDKKGTKSTDIISILKKLPFALRKSVKKVTLDTAKSIDFVVFFKRFFSGISSAYYK
jgi:hypothetical protein